MNDLRKLDHVGYVRFASVYRSFEDVADFREEIEKLERELPSSTEQLQLLGDISASVGANLGWHRDGMACIHAGGVTMAA
ncbi:hypothetical protein G6F59_018619 [Rhizopus arrhizus]|nr:hypothetical protein G6F59_018619 [Rhizopus arrhizus]